MPSTPNTSIGATYQIANTKMVGPQEGPRALVAFLDFTGGKFSATVDLTLATQPPQQLSVIQGAFIDNHAGTVDILLQQVQTFQVIIIKAGQQMYVPLITAATPVFNFVGANNASPGVVVPVFFYNVPIAPLALGAQSIQGLTFNGNNLLVQDTATENSLAAVTALITNQGAGNALNVNVVSGGGSGGTAGPFQWHGVDVSTGATVYTPTAGKRFYINSIKLMMDPGAIRATGQNNFAIQDGGSFVIQGFWRDTTTFTAPNNPLAPLILFESDDMGWLSTTINNTVIFTINHNLPANSLFMNFSTLIGDHA